MLLAGLGVAYVISADLLILMAVFGSTVSYVLMMMSYIKLKSFKLNLLRPYKALDGTVTASIDWVKWLSLLLLG